RSRATPSPPRWRRRTARSRCGSAATWPTPSCSTPTGRCSTASRRRSRRRRDAVRALALIVVLAVAAGARADAPAPSDGGAGSHAAEARLVAGDVAGAVDAFVAVADGAPRSQWADDALAEAARGAEQLGQLARAAALWRRIGEVYPDSRQARRA